MIRRTAFLNLLALLALTTALAGCLPAGTRPPGAPAVRNAADGGLSPLRVLYLELALDQLRRFERGVPRLDEQRLGYGALAAAALAAYGRPTGDDAARWTAAALDACAGRWERVACERLLLDLQRITLQYPRVLPAALLARLRAEAATYVAPPGEEAVRAPWAFRETENQRAVRLARCLAALRIEPGEPGSARAAAAAAWGDAAAAFLRAHQRDGWYEAESPGYIATSMNALFLLADHAPQAAVRALAAGELDRLFTAWAQQQVNGFPAGPKSRSYVHWALGARTTPWVAWAWLLAGMGREERISFMDWPGIATTGYRVPPSAVDLLATRGERAPYEIRTRRHIRIPGRRELDTALYTFATPDYVLGAAQAVDGLRLGVSGGEEIMATLYAAGADFAPLYLWSRTRNLRAERWKSWAGQDLTVGHRNVVLARLADEGAQGPEGGATGYAYLSPPWEPPEVIGEAVVARCGDTYVALVAAGGWDVTPAAARFPDYYGGDPAFRGAWTAVPRRQPAVLALEVGPRAEVGEFASWRQWAATARLRVVGGELLYTARDGTRLAFIPGERATIDGRPLDVGF